MRFLDKRVISFDNKKIRLFGSVCKVHNFEDFYWSFRDIFIEESYYVPFRKKAPCIVDAGANIGVSILYFKWLYPNAHIHAFEPHPENFKLLIENVALNNLQHVFLHHVALSDRRGNIELFGKNRAATIIEGFFGVKGKWNRDVVEHNTIVPTKTLSEYIPVKIKGIDLLKIDIEGAEGIVMQDLSKRGKLETIDYIIIEYHACMGENNKCSDIIHTFEKHNFKYMFFGEGNSVASRFHDRNFSHFMIMARHP